MKLIIIYCIIKVDMLSISFALMTCILRWYLIYLWPCDVLPVFSDVYETFDGAMWTDKKRVLYFVNIMFFMYVVLWDTDIKLFNSCTRGWSYMWCTNAYTCFID